MYNRSAIPLIAGFLGLTGTLFPFFGRSFDLWLQPYQSVRDECEEVRRQLAEALERLEAIGQP